MTVRLNALAIALLVSAAYPAAAQQFSDNKVKIGILNDQSGVYADFGGKWSYEAARMAVEDFRRQGKGHADRGGDGRPPEQSRHRIQHRAPMV